MEVSATLATQVCLSIGETSETGNARRSVLRLAEELGFDENDRGRLAIIATELATNLVKHGRSGELLVRELKLPRSGHGIELLALDKGPGIQDVTSALRDGMSTRGSSGTGLGAVQRLSDVFDIFSRPQSGTAVLSQVRKRQTGRPVSAAPNIVVGAVSLPKPGEVNSGDAWDLLAVRTTVMAIVADGLGHGEGACEAANEAVRIFREDSATSPSQIVQDAHQALRPTRGAAVAVAALDQDMREVRFAGIGNIAGVVVSEKLPPRSMVSHAGIVGHEVRKVHEFTYPWPKGATVIMNSDGLATWHAESYQGLFTRHPSIIAGVLYRDFKRGRDDVTVLVLREA